MLIMSERDLFIEAIEIAEPAERSAWLDRGCGGDAVLRKRLDILLKAFDKGGSLLENPVVASGPTIEEAITDHAGMTIGLYKLLEQIGEGGMGLVFMAEQTQPVRRRVALKILKPGMDTRQVVARFEAERQALALMDHHHIAKVFDAGVTKSGRPYFVMELVRGVPITQYCDERQLSTRHRLELFVSVCQAVQHAHQKGVIHRDLKPSNVLVTQHDTVAMPKIIDFGIAKATNQPLTERTLFTHFSQLIGSPLYMSPEQAEMNGLDVDTRSDVYSLGVLLYELLSGTTPFESDNFKKIGLDEMRRMIREHEPPAPSRRLSTLSAQACSTISERRGVDGRKLGQVLRGELDWIVMKALEKDRDRRYESASALAADVQRYLDDAPVEACPPSASYRLRKYARRNRRALITAGIVAGALVGATAVSTWQAVEANAARHFADIRLDEEKKARKEAATESEIANEVNRFLQEDLLRKVNHSPEDPEEVAQNPHLTVREALDRAAATIEERFQGRPRVEATIRVAIGEAYSSLGMHKVAMPHFEKAVDLRRSSLGADHPDTLDSMKYLAGVYMMDGRSQEAVTLWEVVLDKYERELGPDHPDTIVALNALAYVCEWAGMSDRAITLAKQVLEKRETTLGPTHPDTVLAIHSVACIYLAAGRFEESIAWHQTPLKAMPENGGVRKHYARALQGAGKLEEADYQLRKALEIAQRTSDRTSRERGVGQAQTNLAFNLLLQGRYVEAESMARAVLALVELKRPDSWDCFLVKSLVGGALLGQQRYREAEPLLVEGYEGIRQREAGMDPSFKLWVIKAYERMVTFYEETNQPEKARQVREEIKLRQSETIKVLQDVSIKR